MSDPFDNVTPLRPPGDEPPAAPPPGAGPEEPAGPEKDCAAEPLNDVGNGKRLAAHFGADLIWVPRVGWHVWDRRRWARDPDEIELRRRAQRLGPLIEKEIPHLRPAPREKALIDEERGLMARRAALIGEAGEAARAELGRVDARLAMLDRELGGWKKRVARHATFAKDAGNSGRIRNAMGEASVHLSRAVEEMDAAPLEVCCENGVLRFGVTPGEDGATDVADVRLLRHARDQLITKMMAVAYDPDARAPRFEAFLARVQPDPEMRGFLQRWFGLSMTGLTGEQKLCFFHGGGANGKSVMTDLMARILGDYSATAKVESLTGRNRRGGGDATPDLVPLIGARMVRAAEPDEMERLQEGTIKELTGGEPILIRALHSDFVEVRPVAKITISGNHKPQVRGTDDGIWRRLLLVPWDVQIPKTERDPALLSKLLDEGPGILNWMVEGLLDYLEGGLREPQAVLDATEEYRADSDPVGGFLAACCVVTGRPEDFILTRDLVDAFNFWREDSGESQWTPATISRRLKDKSGRWRDAEGRTFEAKKRSSQGYVGLVLQDLFKEKFDKAPRDHRGRVIWPRGTEQEGET